VPLIGWAALLLGLPVWVVGTTVFLLRSHSEFSHELRPTLGG
jgi:hypothetical protein